MTAARIRHPRRRLRSGQTQSVRPDAGDLLRVYAAYCAVDPDWLRARRVTADAARQEVLIGYPDRRSVRRRLVEHGRPAQHRWPPGTRTDRLVYWPPAAVDAAAGPSARPEVVLVEGESSALSLSFLLNTGPFADWLGSPVLVAGSPGSRWPSEGRPQEVVAAAVKAVRGGRRGRVWVWPDTDASGAPDAGGVGWCASVGSWCAGHGLTPRVIGPPGLDARDWCRGRPDRAAVRRLFEAARPLDAADGPEPSGSAARTPVVRSNAAAGRITRRRRNRPKKRLLDGCGRKYTPADAVRVLDGWTAGLLTAAGAVDRGRGMWSCPQDGHARSDRNPSLSLFAASDGSSGFRCHGCGWSGNAWTLLEARGWTPSDIYAAAHRNAGCCTRPRTAAEGGRSDRRP